MSESCLSQKISLCRCIETLNDDGCLQVIRLLQHSHKYQHLNQFLIRIVMKITDKMNVESLQCINNEMKQIICNDKYVQIEQSAVGNKLNNSENIIFPLFRLPVDIIKNTSLFLNEKDIFSFEQCCRLFYQMINSLSYLKQSNNFHTLTLSDKRFNQIIELKCSFYKYSQANNINVNIFPSITPRSGRETSENVTKFVNRTQSKWEQIKYSDVYDGYWLTSVFKSVKSLTLCHDATMTLLNRLPLKTLFDPQSQFETFAISHLPSSHANYGHLQRAIDEFERQYLEIKGKYQQQEKKMKRLKWLDYSSTYANGMITGPRCIETEHLILREICNDFGAQRLFSTIRVLTCHRGFHMTKLENIDCNINTLRLIGFLAGHTNNICVNNKLIEAFNLRRNLVNLTIEFDTATFDKKKISINDNRPWIKCIETILCKQYYHNLKNVNILIRIKKKYVYRFFDILNRNISILKHQFSQLSIGLRIFVNNSFKYCTFEWCPQIDEKYLNRKQEEMDHDQSKYRKLLNQWK